LLLLTEMIDAAEQAQQLVNGVTVRGLEADRQRRDALLWNFTVLSEAAGSALRRDQSAISRCHLAAASTAAKPDCPRIPV